MPALPELIDLRGELPTRPKSRPYYKRPLEGIVGATVHYTASLSSVTVADIAAYQTGPGPSDPFPAIAYTFVVDWEGNVYQCHDLDVRCWHSGAVVDGVARNSSHVGVCFIGNHAPSLPQCRGLAAAICRAERELGRRLEVEGHRDSGYPTQCPGPIWPAWRSTLMTYLSEFRGG